MGQSISGGQQSGIGVVDKTVAILAAAAATPRTLAELVEATGCPARRRTAWRSPSKVHRLLARDAEGVSCWARGWVSSPPRCPIR